MLDIFSTHATASAEAGGEVYEIATEQNKYKLMTITQELRQVQESNFSTVNQASYVVALASTSSLSNEVLDSRAYGNTDVLLSTLKNTSREVVPTDIELKGIYEYAVEDLAVYEMVDTQTYFRCLVFIPSALILLVGIVVNVRRKYK